MSLFDLRFGWQITGGRWQAQSVDDGLGQNIKNEI